MPTTYQALLRDGHLEWPADAPRHLPPGVPVPVQVTIPDETAAPAQGRRMAAALEAPARSHSLTDLDPAQWQRDLRADRPLPGRDRHSA